MWNWDSRPLSNGILTFSNQKHSIELTNHDRPYRFRNVAHFAIRTDAPMSLRAKTAAELAEEAAKRKKAIDDAQKAYEKAQAKDAAEKAAEEQRQRQRQRRYGGGQFRDPVFFDEDPYYGRLYRDGPETLSVEPEHVLVVDDNEPSLADCGVVLNDAAPALENETKDGDDDDDDIDADDDFDSKVDDYADQPIPRVVGQNYFEVLIEFVATEP